MAEEGGICTTKWCCFPSVCVADNGIGMTEQMAVQAFDLFAQAERKAARSEGGLGLGLALVRSLVELRQGTVTAHSAGLGEGSEFVVTLPRVAATSAPHTGAKRSTLETSERALRVMVVDDNHDAAAMLAMLVETLGHIVVVKHDAAAALAHAASERWTRVFWTSAFRGWTATSWQGNCAHVRARETARYSLSRIRPGSGQTILHRGRLYASPRRARRCADPLGHSGRGFSSAD